VKAKRAVDVMIWGMSQFEIRAQEAEVVALERGHVMADWQKGTDSEGERKWLAPCRTCGALLIVEMNRGHAVMAGNASRLSCQSAKHNADQGKKRRARRFHGVAQPSQD
jgi:hypothetical protein